MNQTSALLDEFLRPIVFVGPSIPLELARQALPNADFRPPIRRGNLDGIPGGAIVGIIDGVFAETLAISPGEIRDAIERGVLVYGAASMGALRAAEISKVVGIGRIFEMYRTGAIERDDEVALLFDPDTFEPLTVALVNLRYGVDRLVRSTTLSRSAGNALVEACTRLHYTERTYPAIFQNSTLAHNSDIEDITRLLRNFDLKREDAQFLLETLAPLKSTATICAATAVSRADGEDKRVQATESIDAPILIWESGDTVEFGALVEFLKMTGRFETFARNAISRFAVGGTPIRGRSGSMAPTDDALAAQSLLDATRMVWGWESPEEAHVTMRDLGLGLLDIEPSLEKEVAARRLVLEILSSRVFARALRAELWMNELCMKREVLRLGALQFFAKRGTAAGTPTKAELDDAKRAVTRLRTAMRWSVAQSDLRDLGLSDENIDAMVNDLALARRAGRPLVRMLDGRHAPRSVTPRARRWQNLGLDLTSSPKAEGSNRFSLPITDAADLVDRVAKQIGVVRVGMIGQLDTLGIHIAQAFGERTGWSSSFSSGKAETREGARIGSVMEEVELYAQDAFRPVPVLRAAFERGGYPLIDPSELDLPFDTRYHDALEVEWSPSIDILACRDALVPSAGLVGERLANDIFYSPRLGGKVFSSSGLGSGFTLAEAVVHAAAELIERHALRLAEIQIDNPGGVGARDFWFVDLASLPKTPRRIVDKYRAAGMCVRILDITPEVAVPTFYARVFDDPFEAYASTTSDGFACHPDPEVAVTMALLEAAQTKAGVIAGGREDYSLQVRSLGRHERPRTMLPRSQVFWFCNDRPTQSFAETRGFHTRDILEELEWMVDRVEDAGYRHFLVTDFTMDRIRPAHATRVVIPGLESTNPVFTGPRARVTLIRDLLPRSPYEAI